MTVTCNCDQLVAVMDKSLLDLLCTKLFDNLQL